MKVLSNILIVLGITVYLSTSSISFACHPLDIDNFTVDYVIQNGDTTGVAINGESNSSTCGCGAIYWMDIEVRCVGEPFDGGPFNPGFYGPVFDYPYFQSPQMNKPSCIQYPYDETIIPFDEMCPGVDYQVRVRENHNGDVGDWSPPLPFQVPGQVVDLEGFAEQSEDSICIGDSINLDFVVTAGCFNGLNFEWEISEDDNGEPDGNWSFVDNEDSIWVAPTVPSWYRVTVDGPCNNDFILDSVFIYVSPVPDLNVLNNTVCLGETVDVTATVDLLGGTYIWEVNPTLNDSVLPNMNPDTNVIYRLDYNYEGCVVSDSAVVTVQGQPTAMFEFDDVCISENASFTDISEIDVINQDEIDSWSWDFGDGNTSNQQNPSHQYDDEGIYEVSLLTVSNNNCVDSITETIRIFPMPVVDFDPIDACIDFNNQFIDQSTVSNAVTSNEIVEWLWDFGNGDTSDEQNTSYMYDAPGSYNAELTVTTDNGCTSSEVKPVIVHPVPDVSFNTDSLAGCAPLCFELVSTSTVSGGIQGIDEYKWIYSNGVTFSSKEDSIHTNCLQNHTANTISYGVTLEVTSDEGCVNSLEVPNLINVYHNPTASFDYRGGADDGSANIFFPEVNFINESRYADFYEWEIEGIGVFTDEEFSYEFDEEPEEYRVDLLVSTEEGCKDSTNMIIEVKDVILFYVPNSFTPDGDGINDYWQPVFTSGFEPMDFNLLVFNNWGEVVWESNDASKPWDGTYGASGNRKAQEGTYIWKIEFKETMSDRRHTETGHVTIIR